MSRIDLPIRSYDLGPSGLTSVQFIRIVGVTGLADQPTNPLFGFDLDAIAAINFASITAAPEPATLALFGIALAGLGFSRRKRAN